ncbi:MAG: rhombosortase [Candidatus Thiodiazotropha sp.]
MRSACLWGVTLAVLVPALWPNPLVSELQFQREALAGGQLWRLFSGHLTHLGWGHLGMNLAGVWLIGGLLLNDHPRWCFTALPWIMLGTSLGLWLGAPQVSWYQGLSGVLHGLLCWALLLRIQSPQSKSAGAVNDTGPSRRTSLLLLLLVMGKLAWENWHGPLPGSESLARGRVIVEAHLYGAVSGGILWVAGWIGQTLRGENRP